MLGINGIGFLGVDAEESSVEPRSIIGKKVRFLNIDDAIMFRVGMIKRFGVEPIRGNIC